MNRIVSDASGTEKRDRIGTWLEACIQRAVPVIRFSLKIVSEGVLSDRAHCALGLSDDLKKTRE